MIKCKKEEYMKKIFMFILAVASVVYLACLCVVQFGWMGADANLEMIATYGGVVIATLIAGFTFFGKGIKLLMLLVLVFVLIVFMLLQVNPGLFDFLR